MTQSFYYVDVLIPIGSNEHKFKVSGSYETVQQEDVSRTTEVFELTHMSSDVIPSASNMLADPSICSFIIEQLKQIKKDTGSLIALDLGRWVNAR